MLPVSEIPEVGSSKFTMEEARRGRRRSQAQGQTRSRSPSTVGTYGSWGTGIGREPGYKEFLGKHGSGDDKTQWVGPRNNLKKAALS